MTDEDDGGAGALGRGLQRAQGMADVLIDAGTDPGGKKGDEGVEDDEGGIGLLDDGVEDGEVAGEGEGAAALAAIGDGDEDDDTLGIAAGGIDAGTDGVVDVVFGGEEEDAAWGSRFQSPPGRASPREMRAASSQRRVLLPRPGSPSRTVILPAGTRPGQSQRKASGATSLRRVV